MSQVMGLAGELLKMDLPDERHGCAERDGTGIWAYVKWAQDLGFMVLGFGFKDERQAQWTKNKK